MRTALMIVALAAFAATPASAKAPRHLHEAPASLAKDHGPGSDLAVRAGNVVGADPDARVRFELQRDNPFY